MSAEHVVFRPVEKTQHEFRCAAYPDIAIVVQNEDNERAACVKLRQMLRELQFGELQLDVMRNP